jgi:hypothetical protein
MSQHDEWGKREQDEDRRVSKPAAPPQDAPALAPLAEVSFACGRWYLKVGGVTLAVEADLCRSTDFDDRCWNRENLTEVARRINDAQRLASAEQARELAQLRRDAEEMQASLCPEDVGIPEYIGSLKRTLAEHCTTTAEQAQTIQKLTEERNTYKTLAGIGAWHNDCRPNRQQAARELQKSQAIIDKLADRITALEADLAAARQDCDTMRQCSAAEAHRGDTARANLKAAQQTIAGLTDELTAARQEVDGIRRSYQWALDHHDASIQVGDVVQIPDSGVLLHGLPRAVVLERLPFRNVRVRVNGREETWSTLNLSVVEPARLTRLRAWLEQAVETTLQSLALLVPRGDEYNRRLGELAAYRGMLIRLDAPEGQS